MKLAALLLVVLAGCGSAQAGPSALGEGDVELPGVDTSQFTPREKHEFSDYVRTLVAPCKEVAVPVGQCVLEKRACEACVPAATAIAKAVRDGYSRDQVEEMYKRRFDASSSSGIPLAGSPSRGPEGARVVVVEFADFECPSCQRIAPALDEAWEKRKTEVRFVYKFMPLAMHPRGEPVARAAIAAQMQGKFWEMHHLLFANPEHHEEADLEKFAAAIGLDVERFRTDMQSPVATDRIAQDRKVAEDLKVHGTPTLFIDGREFDFKTDLNEWLDQEIAARRQSR
jgi:protein-disulfide isomerase